MRFPLRKVIDYAMKSSSDVDRAYTEFFGNLPPFELEDEWEELFLEWLMFDFKQEGGSTFIVEYTLKNPDNLAKMELKQFEEIAKTHFYSNFEILEINEGKWLRLEDLFTGKVYKVYDKKGSESISFEGIIPARAAKVSGKWYLVGANTVYFLTTYSDRAKKHMRKMDRGKFSPKDTVEFLRSQQEKTPTQSVLTKKQLKAKRAKLKNKYEKYAGKYGVTLSFENLLDEIYNEDRVNVLDFWKELEDKGLSEEFLSEHMQILQDIWNYFPHKCLNNLSPTEAYFEMRGDN